MERSRPILKVAAVAVSVCLVGAFVAYRAGAFDSPPPPAPPAEPTPQPDGEPAAAPTPPTQTPASPVFMLGSKSARVYDENLLKQFEQLPLVQAAPATGGTQPATPSTPVFLGGSKSLTPLFPPAATPGATLQPNPPTPAAPKKD
ncbi:MAG TPA: hypothetical protein VM529_25430 [Gemmata sp.]|jgi:hypothetical protein|nr:hypothetical protein [Gemmata sp.]